MNIAVVNFSRESFCFKPDTSLERDVTKDFFIPGFICRTFVAPVIFIRISKPCKAVDPAFAARYFDSFGYGAIIGGDCRKNLKFDENPGPLSLDATAVLPNVTRGMEILGKEEAELVLKCGREDSAPFTTPAVSKKEIERCLQAVTRFCTLRTGDLLALETMPHVPVKKGGCAVGRAFGETLFDFRMR